MTVTTSCVLAVFRSDESLLMCWCTATDPDSRPRKHHDVILDPDCIAGQLVFCPAVAGQSGRINRCGTDRMLTRVLECAVTPRRLPTGKVQTDSASSARRDAAVLS